jgi:hypothetical protein
MADEVDEEMQRWNKYQNVRQKLMRGDVPVKDEEKEFFTEYDAETIEEQDKISQDSERVTKREEIRKVLRDKGMDTQQVIQALAMIERIVWDYTNPVRNE